jgi:AraC-like DNA-binding protein
MYEIFYLGSLFCALLTVYVLLFKQDALRAYADYLLSAYFVFISFNTAIYLLIYYGWIVNVPYLYKTAAPINFIIPPLAYLYVRAVLYNEKRRAIIDIWHFLPFLLFFINYLPFYLIPIVEKKVIVQAVANNLDLTYQYQAGLLPESYTFVIRLIQSSIYLIFQWKLIVKFKKQNVIFEIEHQIKMVLKWLKIFTWVTTVYFLAFIFLSLFVILNISVFNNWGAINFIPGALLSSSFFVMSTYLLTHPGILAGLPFVKYKETKSILSNDEVNKIAFIEEDYSKEIQDINNYFNINKPYLNSNLTLGQVSVTLNIPIRELSYILNNYFNQRFTDFVNAYRLKYIIDNFNKSYLDNFTIESIALEAGFTTKSGFYKSFKKFYKTTPTEYFLKINSL